ncbi:MAG: antibiotic biosynthesis monooxygenase family protein [Xanthobacteraceae bacterium]
MFAVIFEVQPRQERWGDYLDLAKQLKPKLEAIDGFIDIDRLESKRTSGRLLSFSTWRNEKAVIRWRTQAEHHAAQERGRGEIFLDYRLRVGEVTADSAAPAGAALDQQRFDETEVGAAKVVTVTDVMANADGRDVHPDRLADDLGLAADGLIDCEVFASIYTPGKLAVLAAWRDADAAREWVPRKPAWAETLRQRHVRIIRDYGMFERREAPQFYPDLKRPQVEQDAAKRASAS